jgi:hypothetical protein
MAEQKFALYKRGGDGKRDVGTLEQLADKICAHLKLPKGSIEVTEGNAKPKHEGVVLGAIGAVRKTCGGCATSEAKKRCGACQMQFYCSVECQRAHWKVHKKTCPKIFNPC